MNGQKGTRRFRYPGKDNGNTPHLPGRLCCVECGQWKLESEMQPVRKRYCRACVLAGARKNRNNRKLGNRDEQNN